LRGCLANVVWQEDVGPGEVDLLDAQLVVERQREGGCAAGDECLLEHRETRVAERCRPAAEVPNQ